MKEILFTAVCVVHVLVWSFVLFAFMNARAAYYNLFYIIPAIYIIHIFPFHFLVEAKRSIYPDQFKEKEDEFWFSTVGVAQFVKTQRFLENFSFCSPISPQGMLLFGAISSAYRILYTPKPGDARRVR